MTRSFDSRRAVIYDAGALVALDRDDRREWALLRRAVSRSMMPVIPAPVVSQVWRSSRQANLARALKKCKVEDVDLTLAREAGELCARAGTRDAVDAIVVATAARRRGTIVTSDVGDISRLARHTRGVTIEVV